VFIPEFEELEKYMVWWDDEGVMHVPELPPGQKAYVLVTHDESTFNAHDGKRRLWMEKGKQPLRPKSKGKGIMVSDFLTGGGRLQVPDSIPDSDFERLGLSRRYASEYLEYGKDNYWTGEKMVQQTCDLVMRIFPYAFPGCQALFAFDNASNHSCYAEDALLVSKMNLGPGGKQPLLREGFDHTRGLPQLMLYPQNHPNFQLRGKAKGIKTILKERGLWRDRNADGSLFLLHCPITHDRPGCDPLTDSGCCLKTSCKALRLCRYHLQLRG